jgi:hypothetical protein
LQSSADGGYFSTVTVIDGKPGQDFYQFSDSRKRPGAKYYRLKLIGNDGAFLYSTLLQVKANEESVGTMELWPAVVRENALLQIHTSTAGNVKIYIVDQVGRIIRTIPASLQKGHNRIPIQLNEIKPAVYTIMVTGGSKRVITCRFIKTG